MVAATETKARKAAVVRGIAQVALGAGLVLFLVPTSLAGPSVEIEVGNAGIQDDYVCWGPTEARIRLSQVQASPVTVSLATTKHDPATGSGELLLVEAKAGGLPALQVAPREEISISLPADASWKPFYVLK